MVLHDLHSHHLNDQHYLLVERPGLEIVNLGCAEVNHILGVLT